MFQELSNSTVLMVNGTTHQGCWTAQWDGKCPEYNYESTYKAFIFFNILIVIVVLAIIISLLVCCIRVVCCKKKACPCGKSAP